MRNEKGFTLMGLLIIVIVLVVIGAACFFVFKNGKKVETAGVSSSEADARTLDLEDDDDVVLYDTEDKESSVTVEEAIEGFYDPDAEIIEEEAKTAEEEAEGEESPLEGAEETTEETVTE